MIDLSDFDAYRTTVQKTKRSWDKEKSLQDNPLAEAHTNFNQPGEFPDVMLKKINQEFNLRGNTTVRLN